MQHSRCFTALLVALALCIVLLGCGAPSGADISSSTSAEQSSSSQEISAPPVDNEPSSLPETAGEPVATPEESSLPAQPASESSSAAAPQPAPVEPAAAPAEAATDTAASSSASQQPMVTTPGPGGSKFLTNVESRVIQLINQERTSHGLNALKVDTNLNKASKIRSGEMYTNNYFLHERPDGRSWKTVLINDVPINFATAGENIAMYTEPGSYLWTAEEWFELWKNSPNHYRNIMNPGFTHIGAGILTASNADTIWGYGTTLFASY